jgi:hypothetical protein
MAESISQTTIRRCMKYEDNQVQTDCRMYTDAKKLHKNYVMRNKITEMETEEIKMELKVDQRSHINKTVAE